MADPARTTSTQPVTEPVADHGTLPRPSLDIPEGASEFSPAVALQEQLADSLGPREEKFPARYVTSTVIVVCLASWFAMYMLANALI